MFLALALASAGTAYALEVRRLDVSFQGDRYVLATLREGTLSLFTNVEREARAGRVTP